LPTNLKEECDKLPLAQDKKFFAYEVNFDFDDPKETHSLTQALH